MFSLRSCVPHFRHHVRTLSSKIEHEFLISEIVENVGIITLNRPKALNALCAGLNEELVGVLSSFELNKDIGAIVITGSEKAFAAGADIKEMAPLGFADVYDRSLFQNLQDGIMKTQKPIIAAVNGYALGGGCELAMCCDLIIAGKKAKFGQPEITLGTIPGIGGTQRLVRAIGKSKAMEMVLTGNMMNADDAERNGLVARVVEPEQLRDEALKTASQIAGFSQPIVRMAKDAVNASYEMSLKDSLKYESQLFFSSFATKDQKEGMKAFVEKRKPNFTNE